ncbi:MAG: hypothetical protein JSR41_25220 [Proteobacteria bacterium]|nr:hypothetical protein [Pseudomonadota bacterium]
MPSSTPAPSVVLVHGAWADASSGARMVPLLQRAGVPVKPQAVADVILDAMRAVQG